MKRTGLADPALLIVPAFVLLVVLFVVPLVWFFVGILAQEGSLSGVVNRAVAVLSSRAVVTAIITSDWPPIRAGVMKKPIARIKTISDPETTPWTLSGRYTRRKA